MVQIDKNLAWKRESQSSAFTILMWNLSKDNLILELKHRLALISTIKNTFKKVKLNDRLFEFLTCIEKSSIQTYSQIVLIGSETFIFKLDNNDINMLKDYSIPNFTIYNDEYFKIDWLIDIFENFKFYDVIINNSNTLTHWSGNLYKKKIIKSNVNSDYIKNLNVPWFFIGKIQPQHKNKFMIEHYPNNANWNEIINFIEEFEMKKLIHELDTHFINIKLNSDKYIFGNDIFDCIEMYNVEKLYLHDKVKKDFQDKIIQKDLVPNINFKIININKIYSNDSSETLLKDYSGFLGIKYY
jgi:hypothetical protein